MFAAAQGAGKLAPQPAHSPLSFVAFPSRPDDGVRPDRSKGGISPIIDAAMRYVIQIRSRALVLLTV